ncbi:MAG TPA: RagB/SusD family nutrient uptake outer membrane protein [Gemmatimonadaceae bacterium]|jgi:hypothetical protein
MTHTSRHLARLGALAGISLFIACGSGDLTVPNYANPTPDAVTADPLTNLQTRAAGVLNLARRNLGWNSDAGIFGREAFSYGTDSRSTTNYLDAPAVDPGGLASGSWTGFFTTLRAIHDFVNAVDSTPAGVLSTAQVSGAKGFAHTMEALELSYVISSRDSLGIPVDIASNAADITPFVTRDSAYNYIAARLDLAKTELAAGGSAFVVKLNSGFTPFSTPATFLKFNRALAARINVYRASLGVTGCTSPRASTCYTTALQNLNESFIDQGQALSVGAYWIFSAAANDVANPQNVVTNTNLLLHPSIGPDAPHRADGTFDLRYQAKVRRLATARNLGTGGLSIPTDYAPNLYATQATPAPIVKNEELFLLRAEARYFTGDAAGALADINYIRTTSGGLAPTSAFANDDAFITELLLQRRYSLLLEGHRWVDVRRLGKLNTLPIDIPARQFIASRQPVPIAECLARQGSKYPGPGCQ